MRKLHVYPLVHTVFFLITSISKDFALFLQVLQYILPNTKEKRMFPSGGSLTALQFTFCSLDGSPTQNKKQQIREALFQETKLTDSRA